MPAVIPFIPLIAAGAAGGAQVVGAHMQASGANRVADRQSADAARAMAFERDQAENAYRNGEATRKANYDQWAAGQRRIGQLYRQRGWGDLEIPDYVPSVDPGFTSAASAATLPNAQAGAMRTPVTVGTALAGRAAPQAPTGPAPTAAAPVAPPPSIAMTLAGMPGYGREFPDPRRSVASYLR